MNFARAAGAPASGQARCGLPATRDAAAAGFEAPFGLPLRPRWPVVASRCRAGGRRSGAVFVVVLFVVLKTLASENPWFVRTWHAEDGLSNPNVTGLVQTPEGYVWTLTRTTLSRFDGIAFEEFSSTNFTATARSFRALSPRRDGGLWLGMDSGTVFALDAKGSRMLPAAGPATNLVPQTLVEEKNGRLWMTCRGGALYRSENGRMVLVSHHSLPKGSMVSLAIDAEDRLWCVRGGQVGFWQGETFVPIVRVPGNVRIAASPNGGLWICASFRLFRYEHGQLRDLGSFGPYPSMSEPTTLLEDASGAVWIGTLRAGLFRYDGSQFEHVPTSDREIVCLMEDREGNLWAATTSGLNRIQRRALALESTGSGTPFDSVQSVCEDRDGRLWGATENGLLVQRAASGWKVLMTNQATCVAADASGAVWVGTRKRLLYRLHDGGTKVLRQDDGLAGRAILGLLPARAGDLWVAQEAPNSLQCVRSGKMVRIATPRTLHRIRGLVEDAEGQVWFGTEDGKVFRVANDVAIDETARVFPAARPIRSLHWARGSLFIGTSASGLAWFKNGCSFHLSREHGLPDVHASQVVADDAGWLWIGSDRGIYKIHLDELDAWAERKASRVTAIAYNGVQGLPSMQARFGVFPGASRTRDGRLWLPVRTGLAVIDPRKLGASAHPPRVELKQVNVDDQPIAFNGGTVMPARGLADLSRTNLLLRLSSRHRRIDFLFTALDFSAPEKILFRYRLEGFDDGWIEARTERSAGYSRLPAGNYRFRVEASNGDGVWNAAGGALAFSVAPFVWQTWTFRAGALAAVGAVGFAAARYVSLRRLRRRLRTLERQSALDKERARIARDIHDDVGSRLTEIVLLSELELHDRAKGVASDTAQPAGSVADDEARPTAPRHNEGRVRQISTAARQVLKLLDETVWAINPRNDTLPHTINYISQFAAKFLKTAGIRCRMDMPDDPPGHTLSAEARHNLFLTVKEALNNIVQHSSATEVSLRVVSEDKALRIDIEDNGRGFDKLNADASADGLRNMGQRMNEIGGDFQIMSAAGAGTRICLILPWPQ